jgi:hypothetical protein
MFETKRIREEKCVKPLQPTRRFGASGGAAPQKRQCSFASSPPARASVSRRLRQAAWALAASGERQCHIGSDSFTARCARCFADFAHLTVLRNSGGEQNQQACPPPQLRKAVRAVARKRATTYSKTTK